MVRPRLVPNAENASLQELKEAARVGSSELSLRCTAIQFLILETPREKVCGALVITERTLLRWIRAFNERGIDGLLPQKGRGRKKRISSQLEECLSSVLEEPERVGYTFWTARAFHGFLRNTYRTECSYSTVLRFFHEQGFALKVPQPWPDRQDEKQRQAFREQLRLFCDDPDTELWYGDESGFEGESRTRRRWDKKGNKTRVVRNGDHTRMNVLGMVAPRTGEFFAIEASHVDTEMFQAFLDEAARTIQPQRKRNVLILDNAAWHLRKCINWHFFDPVYLPSYSPDLNPIERIWNVLKARWFTNVYCKDRHALILRLDEALNDIMDHPEENQRTAAIGQLI